MHYLTTVSQLLLSDLDEVEVEFRVARPHPHLAQELLLHMTERWTLGTNSSQNRRRDKSKYGNALNYRESVLEGRGEPASLEKAA